MGYVYMSFRPEVQQNDAERLRSMLPTVGVSDTVDITVENSDAHQTDILYDVLDQQGFDYQPKGGQGDTYHILARRRPN
jgi:hypothetical protein